MIIVMQLRPSIDQAVRPNVLDVSSEHLLDYPDGATR